MGVAALHLVEQRDQEARAGCADGVADGYRARFTFLGQVQK